MAIFSCNFSNVSRAKGGSAVAAAAYITCTTMYDLRTGECFPYSQKNGLWFSEVLLPKAAPEEYLDPEVLFNAIETYEENKDAKVAKREIVALPRELTDKQRVRVMRDYIEKVFTRKGYAALYAIHDKNDGNPHAHILIPSRKINSKGEWEEKEKKVYALDEKGERIPILNPDGTQKLGPRNEKLWKRERIKYNDIELKAFLLEARKEWAFQCNKFLAPEHQIDCRSYEDQGLAYEPTLHEGYIARKIEARGGFSEKVEENRKRRKYNQKIKEEYKAIDLLKKEIENLKESIEQVREYLKKVSEAIRKLKRQLK